MKNKKRIAIVGMQGIPARYGGFETLVENIVGENCSPEIEYTAFCSSKDMPLRLAEYKGVHLKYIPLRANGMQSIPYDMWSMYRAMWGYETILVLGTSGCLFLPVLRLLSRAKIVVNIDGLEHRRAKWGKMARWILRKSEVFAMKFAHAIIADNKGIQDYVRENYQKEATLIAYGGDHVLCHVEESKQQQVLERYGVRAGGYGISVCRIEPENNCHITLEAFARSGKELVFIGNWQRFDYGRELCKQYSGYKNIHFVDSVYDLDTLWVMRRHAAYYIHGHSAGGTNPSLVEAMFFPVPILCFDVVYNRETTCHQSYYWKDTDELQALLERDDLNGESTIDLAQTHYTWAKIAKQYEQLYR